MNNVNDVLKMIKDKDVKFVDLRFTDTKGKMQHVTDTLLMARPLQDGRASRHLICFSCQILPPLILIPSSLKPH